MRILRFAFVALLLAGCAAPLKQIGADAAASPDAVAAVDPQSGALGALKLGMTADQAIAAMGPPETQYDDFLAWRGGTYKATLQNGQIVALAVMDPHVSIAGFHVGDSLAAAEKAFPNGQYEDAEVPRYVLPGNGPHAWLQVMPGQDHEIFELVMSTQTPESDDH